MRLSRSWAGALGIDAGLVVTAIASDGPAARAGIRLDDIVLGIAGPSPVAARHIRDAVPGAILSLTVWRDRQRVDVPVEVGTRPPAR